MKTDETVLRALKKAFLIGKIYGEVFESIDSTDQTAAESKKLEFERLCEATIRNLNSYALQHPDDEAVDRFANAMKQKLAQAREKGRSGWQQMNPNELSGMLYEHVAKGDPRDVANFCMFLWNLGQPITPCQPVQPAGAQGEPVAKAVSGKREVSCHGPNRKYVDGVVLVQLQELEPETLLYSAPPAAAINEQLLEALNDFSNYVRTEQSSTDGQVQYSNTQINRLAFKARAAIAAAEAEKAKGGAA